MLRLGDGSEISEFEMHTLENMEREGLRDKQFRTDDAAGELSSDYPEDPF